MLGRTAPSTVLDANDSTLSRRHISLSHESGHLLLRDLGSRNGTYVKVHRRWTLEHGDLIWIGHQLLRVEIGESRPAGPAVIEGRVSDASEPGISRRKPAGGDPTSRATRA